MSPRDRLRRKACRSSVTTRTSWRCGRPDSRCSRPARCRRPTTSRSSRRRRPCAAGCRSSTSSTASAPRTSSTPSSCSTTTSCGRWSPRPSSASTGRARCRRSARSCGGPRRTPTSTSRRARRSTRSTRRTPRIVQEVMDELAGRTGRAYRLVEYAGHPEAERVVVIMGSGAETVRETVNHLLAGGERVGVLRVRLYRPFPTAELVGPPAGVAPGSSRVLDRTKEPGSNGEPLYLDVVAAAGRPPSRRCRDRRCRGSSAGVMDCPARSSRRAWSPACSPRCTERRRRPGSRSASSTTSAARPRSTTTPSLDIEDDRRPCGPSSSASGSDGTVGANKNTIKILGADPEVHAQAYFVYDSKKSGGTTISHLRFGPHPVRAPYLVSRAGFVGCHQFGLLDKLDVLGVARPGAVLLLNAPMPPTRCGTPCPGRSRRRSSPSGCGSSPSTPGPWPADAGLPGRTNTDPADLLLRHLRRPAARRGDRGGQDGDPQDLRAPRPRGGAPQRGRRRRRPWRTCIEVPIPGARDLDARTGPAMVPRDAPEFVRTVTAEMMAGRGRRPPGERAARGRHLPQRHDGIREAADLRPRRPMGSAGLHPVRQLRVRLPAQRHPVEVLRRGRPRRGTGAVRVGAPQRGRPARGPLHPPGLRRGLHRLRSVRRGVPGDPQSRGRRARPSTSSTSRPSSTRGRPTSASSSRCRSTSGPGSTSGPSAGRSSCNRCSSSPGRAPGAARPRT